MQQKKNKTGNPSSDRTTGTGARASVSRATATTEDEDLNDSSLNEGQKHRLETEDGGATLEGDRTQRKGS
jgi:hypothetical protein